jgi:hypothetical protein
MGGKLHVKVADAGSVTAYTGADDLVVENSATGGISILTASPNTGYLSFGDNVTNGIAAYMSWASSAYRLNIDTNAANGNIKFATGLG